MNDTFSAKKWHIALLLLALAIAAALRLWRLDGLPPALNFDEAGNGIAALDIAHGNFKIWWDIGGGKEPLMAYLTQPLFWLFGITPLALRLYAALMGIAAVGATYFLARQLFFAEPENGFGWKFVPLWAAFGLATAFWHVSLSRIAFRANALPVVEALAFGFLWRGLRTRHTRDFLWAGGFTGLVMYTYLAGRLLPLALIVFFGAEAIAAWRRGQSPLLVQFWRQLLAMVGVAVAVDLPLAVFFARHPALLNARAGAVSIFSPAVNGGNLWGALWHTTATTLGTFFAVTGDPNSLVNIPGKPELSAGLAVLFAVGVIMAVARQSAYRPQTLFVLLAWGVILLPAILAPEGAPHHLRLIGTAPLTYILVAMGLAGIGGWLARRIRVAPLLPVSLLAVLVFGVTGVQTARDYFSHWANGVDHYMDFDVYAAELAATIAGDGDSQVRYVIPMDLRAGHEARHYSLEFYFAGEPPYRYVLVDENTLAQSLTAAARGKSVLKVVRWTQDKHREADAKGLVTFLLAIANTVPTAADPARVYTIETYRLPDENTVFAFPKIESPVDVTLDGEIQVRRSWVASRPTATGQVAAAVTFAPIAPIADNLKASMRLVAPDGSVRAQTDRVLLHNWHQPTSLWLPEEVHEYYLLALPADAPTGEYSVRLVVYHPDTLAPLTDNGLVGVSLGAVAVGK